MMKDEGRRMNQNRSIHPSPFILHPFAKQWQLPEALAEHSSGPAPESHRLPSSSRLPEQREPVEATTSL
jgi:hypothetical protein